jgi:hypothetical protein
MPLCPKIFGHQDTNSVRYVFRMSYRQFATSAMRVEGPSSMDGWIPGGDSTRPLAGHYSAPNVRNKNVLRSFGKSGFPLSVAAPFAYPPTIYFHPNVVPPLNFNR